MAVEHHQESPSVRSRDELILKLYGDARQPRVSFSGTRRLMEQCELFWRETLGYSGLRPSARPHHKRMWTYALWGGKARRAAEILLAASPVSMRRKRAILAEIAGSKSEQVLCRAQTQTIVSWEKGDFNGSYKSE
jgi:hypothetical protein